MGLLTGQARTATVIARDDVLCYRLEKRGFDAILKARPELAEALSQVAGGAPGGQRRDAAGAGREARSKRASGAASELLRKIRVFFDLAQ